MNVSLNWLREYIEIDVSVSELCDTLTMLGLEIEGVHRPGEGVKEVYIGRILSIDPHPDAEKLVVCKTDVGRGQPLQIVCGAKNMKPGDKVPTAVVGGELPGGFKIGARKMRGIESQGMMCSAKELGLGDDHDGLLILDPALPIGEDARKALGLDDTILEIEITPNRGDWASMIGVARELAAAYGGTLRIPDARVVECGSSVTNVSSVKIEAPDLCPRYVGRVLTNVRIGPSPAWLGRRLAAAGQRSINNVVDITNYVMLETGQPLHAFDFDKLAQSRIVVRRAQSGEGIKTIDQETRPLSAEMLVIADAERPVAVAGVMGGFDSEVGEGTTSIFLESAYFAPVSVRRTSRSLNLITESSQRFQRGVDVEMTLWAANRASQLIQDLAGGNLAAGVLDAYPKPMLKSEITLRYSRANAALGVTVPVEKQRTIVLSLGFEEIRSNADMLAVRAPAWRHDCSLEADLIEEVARLHGYDAIPTDLPRVRHSETVFAPHYEPLRRLRHFLVSLGLSETIPWTFSSAREMERAGISQNAGSTVTIANPLTENHAIMRSTLAPSLLNTAANTIRKSRRDVAAFEIGPVYRWGEKGDLPIQEPRLGIVLSGNSCEPHWSHPARPVDFYDLKGYAEDVLDFMGAPQYLVEACASGLFADGQAAQVRVGDALIGTFGRIAGKVCQNYEIDHPLFALELELHPLLGIQHETPQFREIPNFPLSLRDLAVVVDNTVSAGAVRDTAQSSGGKLLRKVEIFDIYRGGQLPPGKKSIALSLVFQSDEKTLTDKDTQKVWDKIVRALEHHHGAQLR